MRAALSTLSAADAEQLRRGRLTKWQGCLILSWFWLGNRSSPSSFYIKAAPIATLCKVLYWLVARDADDRKLCSIFPDAEVLAMQCYQEKGAIRFDDRDLWNTVDEYRQKMKETSVLSLASFMLSARPERPIATRIDYDVCTMSKGFCFFDLAQIQSVSFVGFGRAAPRADMLHANSVARQLTTLAWTSLHCPDGHIQI